jgi:hypothetical protein
MSLRVLNGKDRAEAVAPSVAKSIYPTLTKQWLQDSTRLFGVSI